MRLSVIRLVLAKELRETLRDRRTLFVMIVLPILLYPLLMLGMTAVAAKRVAKLGARQHRVAISGEAEGLRAHLAVGKALRLVPTDDVEAAVRDGDAVVGLRIEPGFEEALDAQTKGRLEVVFSNVDERSLAGRAALRNALDEYRDAILAERLGGEERLRPFLREEIDVSGVSPASTFAARVLGLFLVLMMLTAAFYPAVDLGAGEKERGTLETLLVAPVGRAELVMGKYLTVLLISLAAALLNLGAMGLTFSRLAGALPGGESQPFSVEPGAIAAMLLLLLPLGALFSAAALALSAFARSYKEGMHYLTPLAVVVTPLALVASLPDVELDTGLALMPVTGSVLVFRDLMLGKGSFLHGALAFGSTALVAGAVLRWCVGLFNREEILFRPAGGGGIRALRAEAKRRGLPSGGEAWLMFAVGLALIWFLGSRLLSGTSLVRGHVLNQLIVVAAPALVYAGVMGFRMRETFRFRLGRPRILVAAALLGPAAAVLFSQIYIYLLEDRTGDAGELERMLRTLMELPFAARILLLAVLPAVCEEILFRGFLLTGLRRAHGPVRAALLCGLMFGLFHLSPIRIPVTGALGVVLAALALRGASIVPAMICHALYNAVVVSLADAPAWATADLGPGFHPFVLGAAVLLAVAGIFLTLAGDRRE